MPVFDDDVRQLVDAITAAVERDGTEGLEVAVRTAVTAWVDNLLPFHRSTRDPLTGLFNREMFSEDLDRLVAGAHRVGMPALLVADIDDFTQTVERHGAQVGDEVLKRVGHCLAEASRGEDLIARVEDDTFAVLVPGPIHPEEARAIGERFQAVVRSDAELKKHKVTISVGIAWSPELLDSVQLLTMAQKAMRMAKATRSIEVLEELPKPGISEVA
jgi:diguanylate cyclase (GGDEF)-like protein